MENLERNVKIVSAIAVPIIIAIFGWMIQNRISDKNLERDYVQIAVGILTTEDIDPGLSEWAVELLNAYSQVQMEGPVQKSLKSGELRLPVGVVRTEFIPATELPVMRMQRDRPD